MHTLTRRSALKTTLAGLTTAWLGPLIGFEPLKPKFAFSTLGCPNWGLDTILKTAVDSGYQGVEFRGLMGELDLTKSPAFSTAACARETRDRFAGQGIRICDLGSSAQLHHADTTKRKQQLDEARRFIDLAHQLNCPFVRVFPDQLPPDQPRQKTLQLISGGLQELGQYARGSGVGVLLESHGELTRSNLLIEIMQPAQSPNVGLVWDIVNMWVDAQEAPTEVYAKLKPYIRHIHVKDVRIVNGTHRYVPIGTGEAPLREAITALKNGKFDGYYSFEWEKRWHPELPEPEQVLPGYPTAMKAYF